MLDSFFQWQNIGGSRISNCYCYPLASFEVQLTDIFWNICIFVKEDITGISIHDKIGLEIDVNDEGRQLFKWVCKSCHIFTAVSFRKSQELAKREEIKGPLTKSKSRECSFQIKTIGKSKKNLIHIKLDFAPNRQVLQHEFLATQRGGQPNSKFAFHTLKYI